MNEARSKVDVAQRRIRTSSGQAGCYVHYSRMPPPGRLNSLAPRLVQTGSLHGGAESPREGASPRRVTTRRPESRGQLTLGGRAARTVFDPKLPKSLDILSDVTGAAEPQCFIAQCRSRVTALLQSPC